PSQWCHFFHSAAYRLVSAFSATNRSAKPCSERGVACHEGGHHPGSCALANFSSLPNPLRPRLMLRHRRLASEPSCLVLFLADHSRNAASSSSLPPVEARVAARTRHHFS